MKISFYSVKVYLRIVYLIFSLYLQSSVTIKDFDTELDGYTTVSVS